jgi:putative GTP pyrophosphokinase
MQSVSETTWQEDYGRRMADYQRLQTEAEWILDTRITAKGIKLHTLVSRVKDLPSLEEKAERKGYSSPLEQTPDVVGIRAVVLFRSDMEKVADIVAAEFDIIGISDTVGGVDDPSTFGYMSQHYVARLPDKLVGPRYEGLYDVRFEVQVRTILMDAWANVSHYLAYKGESSIPLALRRDFNALSGLFYVADTHFELFFDQTTAVREQAGKELVEEATDIPLNLDTLAAYLVRRFPDRIHDDRLGVGSLVNELLSVGYTTIAELDERLNSAQDAFVKDEKDHPPTHTRRRAVGGAGGRYLDVGVVRVSLRLTDEAYQDFEARRDAEREKQT